MRIDGGSVGVARAAAQADLRAALIAARPDKAAVASGAARALGAPILKSSDQAKAQAKAKVQQIVERLKILRKLFAFDPKRMAQALAEAFKELKSAVKAYAKAGGDALGAAGDAAGSGAPPAPAPASAGEDGQAEGDDAKTEAAAPTPSAANDYALGGAVTGEVRKAIGEDGLDFIKQVRALSNDLKDLLEAARTQARARKPDKETGKALEDADTSLGDLRQEMSAMEQDIHDAVPAAGLRLSMEA